MKVLPVANYNYKSSINRNIHFTALPKERTFKTFKQFLDSLGEDFFKELGGATKATYQATIEEGRILAFLRSKYKRKGGPYGPYSI